METRSRRANARLSHNPLDHSTPNVPRSNDTARPPNGRRNREYWDGIATGTVRQSPTGGSPNTPPATNTSKPTHRTVAFTLSTTNPGSALSTSGDTTSGTGTSPTAQITASTVSGTGTTTNAGTVTTQSQTTSTTTAPGLSSTNPTVTSNTVTSSASGVSTPSTAAGGQNSSPLDQQRLAMYHEIATCLCDLLGQDLSLFTPARIKRHIQNIRKTVKNCDTKFNELINSGVPVSYLHHQDLMQDAADELDNVETRIPINMRTESGEEFHTTMPREICAVEYDALNATQSTLTMRTPLPAGFLDPSRPWDTSMATAVAQLETSPVPKFSGDSQSLTWHTFWSQWKQRVHDLPDEALSIAVKYDKLVNSLTGTAATFAAGLGKLDAASAYQMLVTRLHGSYYRIPLNPEKILQRLNKTELSDNSIDATCEWVSKVQAIAFELIQAGRNPDEAHRVCFNHLYNGLSESVRGQLDMMLRENASYTTYADKFNASATYLWVKLINLKNREELPKKKLLSFEQSEKSLLYQKSGNGRNPRGKQNKVYPPRDSFASDHEYEKFMRKMLNDNYDSNPNTSLTTVLHSNITSYKPKNKAGCPFHKQDPSEVKHSANECRLPVHFRLANIAKHKVCTVCLQSNHKSNDCKNKYTCPQCDERHAQLLCPKLSIKKSDNKHGKKQPFTGGKRGKKKFKPKRPTDSSSPPKKQRTQDDDRKSKPAAKSNDPRPVMSSTLKQDPSLME